MDCEVHPDNCHCTNKVESSLNKNMNSAYFGAHAHPRCDIEHRITGLDVTPDPRVEVD